MKENAFWDTSALVPLCIPNQASAQLRLLARRYNPVVWWACRVEARSAFAKQLRSGALTLKEHANAHDNLATLRRRWEEMQPSDDLRIVAEELLDRYSLSAADALQLAAAYTWTEQRPFGRSFIAGDKRLLAAAHAIGFRAIPID